MKNEIMSKVDLYKSSVESLIKLVERMEDNMKGMESRIDKIEREYGEMKRDLDRRLRNLSMSNGETPKNLERSHALDKAKRIICFRSTDKNNPLAFHSDPTAGKQANLNLIVGIIEPIGIPFTVTERIVDIFRVGRENSKICVEFTDSAIASLISRNDHRLNKIKVTPWIPLEFRRDSKSLTDLEYALWGEPDNGVITKPHRLSGKGKIRTKLRFLGEELILEVRMPAIGAHQRKPVRPTATLEEVLDMLEVEGENQRGRTPRLSMSTTEALTTSVLSINGTGSKPKVPNGKDSTMKGQNCPTCKRTAGPGRLNTCISCRLRCHRSCLRSDGRCGQCHADTGHPRTLLDVNTQ